MEMRKDVLTGKPVSLLGFGCMRLPVIDAKQDQIDIARAQEMIDYAYENGVNYFDTAYPYHEGKSELFIGESLKKYPRDSFFLADKMPGWSIKSAEDAPRIFYEQLEKCQVEYFDYYLCHSVGRDATHFTDVYEKFGVLEFLLRMKKEGKIRHLGFSFHGPQDCFKPILDYHDWDFVQIQLNYVDWTYQDAREKYEMLTKRGIPCVVMEPVQGGNLVKLCDKSVERLKAAEPDRSIASWAIRFAASLPNVMTVLSGMSDMAQVKDNADTIGHFKALNEQDQELLEQARRDFLSSGSIPCTGCRYCMDCPSGVDIPRVFFLYNRCVEHPKWTKEAKAPEEIKTNASIFFEMYHILPTNNRAGSCISCDICKPLCPQSIAISERMQEIRDLEMELDAYMRAENA